MKSGETYVRFNVKENYWGDKPQNLEKLIQQAHKKNLKVLVKPHIWVEGEGWPGDFSPGTGRWKIWQENYTLLIDQLVEICERNGVEMLCIGTEFKNAVITKPGYWKWLIHHIRKSYSGKLTYAANWDNYMYIPFWKELDLIGIDAYFPLNSDITPSVNSVKTEWENIAKKLERFSEKQGKRIIFTECGYRSTDACAYKQWLIESLPADERVNLQAQVNAYSGFYQALWEEDWLRGGFIWKWYGQPDAGGELDSDFTPENKPVEEIIRRWYSE
jgi:hypothetical protein